MSDYTDGFDDGFGYAVHEARLYAEIVRGRDDALDLLLAHLLAGDKKVVDSRSD